ncbi:dihydropteroate synthase [Paenibacillus profundus]|uniref:Dihydropteroate synthase n=1 Tax=Paenibacillus profundus TaxID=1173085 RepID=A0ABS8YKH7_9BACL|nr:dihydropteroate synthase [Paenibacillus profundus]MCE5172378.1 dihydropteroate synthase [Paenibacillus profundus]
MLQPTFRQRTYQWDNCSLSLGSRTLVMGILNVTPDSFSDGGRYNRVDRAITHVREMVAQGADIIDIGGESTRPGFEPVGAEEELSRVIPVIEALHAEMPQIPISVDTYKAEVGRRALEAGAHILNDIWGCKKDEQMARAAAQYQCPIILMHNRPARQYDDFVQDVKRDLLESVAIATAAGVKEENIWLDPGIGFAKNLEDNLTLMHHLDELGELGYPVLLAASRKRFIRDTLQLPVDELVEGTAATTALGIAQGCQIVRVHDIEANVRTARMCDAMLYPR